MLKIESGKSFVKISLDWEAHSIWKIERQNFSKDLWECQV